MNLLEAVVMYQLIAQAYGESNYSSSEYGGGTREQETETGTTQETTPQAPLTGLFRDQPPSVIIPALLLVAVVIGTVSFIISRAVRRRRSNKS